MLLDYWGAIELLKLDDLEGEEFSSIRALMDLCENYGLPHAILPIAVDAPWKKLRFTEEEILEWVSQLNGLQGPKVADYVRFGGEHDGDCGLSVRSRKALGRVKVVFVEELTAGVLEGVRNCGSTTVSEILNWRDELIAANHQSSSSSSSSSV